MMNPLDFLPGEHFRSCGHLLECDDLHRAVRVDHHTILQFSLNDYRLLLLLLQHGDLSYQDMLAHLYPDLTGQPPDEEFLEVIRRRIRKLRQRCRGTNLNIVNMAHYGYTLRPLSDARVPYRTGHRVSAPPSAKEGKMRAFPSSKRIC